MGACVTTPYHSVLFYAISGQRNTRRTALVHELKKTLPSLYPDQTFTFLPSPFKSLPFPLLWNTRERDKQPVTRLLSRWSELDDYCFKKLRPALEEARREGHIVINDGFGLDALLYATALCESQEYVEEAFGFHSSLVSARIVEQHLPAPEYFITRADVESVDRVMREKKPQLNDIDPSERRRFIFDEEQRIAKYFGGSVSHQKEAHYLDAWLTVQEMAGEVAKVIGRQLSLHALRAA